MYFIRHGQSVFNALFNQTGVDPGVIDAPLTPRGADQAKAAPRELLNRGITRIISSPYTRALQTAQYMADALGLPITANPLIGERSLYTCDIGTPTAQLKTQWPKVDFSTLTKEKWWPHHHESQGEIERRVAAFMAQATHLPDKDTTLIVSHWYFIFTATGEDAENAEIIWQDNQGLYHKLG